RQAQKRVLGRILPSEPDSAPIIVAGGRLYFIVSNIMAAVGQSRFGHAFANVDPLAAQAVMNTDISNYHRTHYSKIAIAEGLSRYLFTLSGPAIKAALNPNAFLEALERDEQVYFSDVAELNNLQLSLEQYAHRLLARTLNWI